MSRILLTGMTAAQVNPVNHERSPNFMGLLRCALLKDGHEVVWSEPSVLWSDGDLKQYDLVVVGVSPITGLGANRAYGALSIIEQMWDSNRLRLLVDAPDPIKMESANQSIVDHPENLTKDFFSYRKEFQLVRHDHALQQRLLRAVNLMNFDVWPTTIVPQLPWQTTQQFERQLPQAIGKVRPLNLDHLIFSCFDQVETERYEMWALEAGSHPTWARRTGTVWSTKLLPKTHRRDITDETIHQLAESAGTIICPSKMGTWWSPRYAMSLTQRTPVFTDWHETIFLSSSWVHLPSGFEMMDPDKREQIADEQYASYTQAIPHGKTEI